MQLRYQKYLKNMAIKPAGAFLTLKDALKIAQIILKVKFLQSKCYRFTVNSISPIENSSRHICTKPLYNIIVKL